MAEQLSLAHSGTRGTQRILRSQIDKALEALADKTQSLSDKAIHSARKELKKARASLRLLREQLGSRLYRHENFSLRDAARPLTEVRDARVLVETIDALAEHFAGEVSRDDVAEIRRTLKDRMHALRQEVLHKGQLDAVKEQLKAARKRAKSWPVRRRGWSILGAGLKRVYRQGRLAFQAAGDDATVEHLHEWRKQAKYLWHQLQLLQPLWPAVLEELAEQVHRLTQHLGDDHDLAILAQKLQDPEGFPNREAVEQLAGLIERRRAELQEQAWRLGRRIYAEKPRQLVGRLKRYWQVWRLEEPSRRGKEGKE